MNDPKTNIRITKNRQVTVRELVDMLQKLPDRYKNMSAFVEGCDCEGDCCGIQVDEDQGVLFCRLRA